MKVKDLIAQLQQMNPEAAVHFAYCYGDRTRTMVAPEATEVEETHVVDSAYHDMPRLVHRDDMDEIDALAEAGEAPARVVVIS